jgi:hypothetical protein
MWVAEWRGSINSSSQQQNILKRIKFARSVRRWAVDRVGERREMENR